MIQRAITVVSFIIFRLIYRISSRIKDIPKSDQDEAKRTTLTDLGSVFYLPDKEEYFGSFPTVHSITLVSKHSTWTVHFLAAWQYRTLKIRATESV